MPLGPVIALVLAAVDADGDRLTFGCTMIESFFSADMRRNPFPFYERCRAASPVLYLESLDLWMIFDYAGVKRALEDHRSFSSAAMPPGSTGKPLDWLIFKDPPRHARLRALVAGAFTPRVVASLEPRIRQISRELLDGRIEQGEMDLAADYSIPLPLCVIAELLGIPPCDRPQFRRWSDAILGLAETVGGGEAAARAAFEYGNTTAEMDLYLKDVLQDRRRSPQDDLLSRLAGVVIDGQRLTHAEILSFFQLLLLAGSETTINLINNAVICFLEHPEQLARVRAQPELLPTAIEEVLRHRSPLQTVFRQTACEVNLGGQTIPPGKLVLPMIGSANRDPTVFVNGESFDITREPNPHLAFGHGIHFCLGASLARLESRIAIGDILERMEDIELATPEAWEPGRHSTSTARSRCRSDSSFTASRDKDSAAIFASSCLCHHCGPCIGTAIPERSAQLRRCKGAGLDVVCCLFSRC